MVHSPPSPCGRGLGGGGLPIYLVNSVSSAFFRWYGPNAPPSLTLPRKGGRGSWLEAVYLDLMTLTAHCPLSLGDSLDLRAQYVKNSRSVHADTGK